MIDARVSSLMLAMAVAAACSRGAERGGGPPAPQAAAPADGQAETAAKTDRPAEVPAVVLTMPGREPVRVVVELARTAEERRRGLMYRQNLGAEAGMLFLFEQDDVHAFWMKNTLIPLDMIFIRKDGTVAGVVENAEPKTLKSRSIGQPSRHVLEVNGGFARAHGIREGTRVSYEHVDMTGYDK